MTDLARRQDQALVNQAHTLEVEIKQGIRAIHFAWVLLAEKLFEFNEQRGWKLVGHDTLDEFLAQHDVGMKTRQFFRLVEAHRELVLMREVDPERLGRIEQTKVAEVLPAIRRGDLGVDEGLDMAEALGFRDLRRELGSEAEQELGRVPCERCGSLVAPDKLRDAA